MKAKLIKIFQQEISAGKSLYNQKLYQDAFKKFERAHIIGQKYIVYHTISHYWMLKLAVKTKDFKEVYGQLIRIPLGILGSAIGLIPTGNTGGSNVSIFKSMEIPNDLKSLFDNYQ